MNNTEVSYLLEDLRESRGIDFDELLWSSLTFVRQRHGLVTHL